MGEVREECPDLIIQLSDITLERRKVGYQRYRGYVTIGTVNVTDKEFRISVLPQRTLITYITVRR